VRAVRRKSGHAISEFAAALIVLVTFVFAPLINVGIVPIRYLMAQGVLTELCHRVVLSERRSEAISLFTNELWSKSVLQKCGVEVSNAKIGLTVLGKDNSKLSIVGAEPIPSEWLPGGSMEASVFSLEISVDCAIAPLFQTSPGLPGFTSPVVMKLKASSPWENFGIDPVSQEYFVNE